MKIVFWDGGVTDMVAVGELLAVAKVVGGESGGRREALRASLAAPLTNRRSIGSSLFWAFLYLVVLSLSSIG